MGFIINGRHPIGSSVLRKIIDYFLIIIEETQFVTLILRLKMPQKDMST